MHCIKEMRQILSSMWLCALFSWKVDHINPLFRKRPCRCLDSGTMGWNYFWWSNMTNSICQVSQKYMWKMLRSTNPRTPNPARYIVVFLSMAKNNYHMCASSPALEYKPLLNTNHTWEQNFLKKSPWKQRNSKMARGKKYTSCGLYWIQRQTLEI